MASSAHPPAHHAAFLQRILQSWQGAEVGDQRVARPHTLRICVVEWFMGVWVVRRRGAACCLKPKRAVGQNQSWFHHKPSSPLPPYTEMLYFQHQSPHQLPADARVHRDVDVVVRDAPAFSEQFRQALRSGFGDGGSGGKHTCCRLVGSEDRGEHPPKGS